MQASRQNTRQLAALESELLEWHTSGFAWSLVNYGPGRLWFNYSGEQAVVGMPNSTELRSGFSFTHSESPNRFMELSLQAVEPLTYSLVTNQRYTGQAGGIEEAPSDGVLYSRRNAAWAAIHGQVIPIGAEPGWTTWRLTAQVLFGGSHLQLVGELTGSLPPNSPTPIITFPPEFRPITQQMGICAASTGTAAPGFCVFVLQTNGVLTAFVPIASIAIYPNNLFPLSQ